MKRFLKPSTKQNEFLNNTSESITNTEEDESRINEQKSNKLLIEDNQYLKEKINELQKMNTILLTVCDTYLLLPRDEIHSMFQAMYVNDYKKEVID